MKPIIVTGRGGITAQVIEHSRHPVQGSPDLITIQLRYPRIIHAELLTHRVFSRNSSSSRAIPVRVLIEQVEKDPFVPFHWGKNQAGMQAREELQGIEREQAIAAWLDGAKEAVRTARELAGYGLHKQIANRGLETYSYISVIVTSTEWFNFFALRDHPDAEPHIQELAKVMWAAIGSSHPRTLNAGDWHLPYVSKEERSFYSLDSLRKMSAARCARVSYLTHDGKTPDVGKDFALFDDLVAAEPLHASPIEHQASPDRFDPLGNGVDPLGWAHQDLWGNFRHWVQFRKMHEKSFATS